MDKATAIDLLGGTVAAAAKELDITPSAIYQWPDKLTEEIEIRVLAAQARKHLPPELLGRPAEPPQPEAPCPIKPDPVRRTKRTEAPAAQPDKYGQRNDAAVERLQREVRGERRSGRKGER